MIRDPSDGSVKVEHHPEPLKTCEKNAAAPVLNAGVSGLRISPADAAYADRLAKSREWMKDFHARKRPGK